MDEISKLIIVESIEVELDLDQIIYDIHFSFPELSISDKYHAATTSLIKLDALGYIHVCEVLYEKKDNILVIASEQTISGNQLNERLKHPRVWDRACRAASLASSEPILVVEATAEGISAIGSLPLDSI